jgi:modulator of FtsH protease
LGLIVAAISSKLCPVALVQRAVADHSSHFFRKEIHMSQDNTILNPVPSTAPAGTIGAAQLRVLRNTYLLLAISLVPTVIGALIGMSMGFSLLKTNPILGIVLFLGIAFGFFYAIEKTKNSVWGVPILLAFTFFMGLMLSGLLSTVKSLPNGGMMIATAFGGTAAIFMAMASLGTVIKRDLSKMGKFLFIGVIMLLIAGIANVFLQMPALYIALSVIAIGIFSAFMVYDINQIVTGGETNYISATLSLYLDIYNVFSNLLALLGITSSD